MLVGAFGGMRADHAFLHLSLALHLAEVGTGVRDQRHAGRRSAARRPADVRLRCRHAVFDPRLSALSGLSVTGAKWPLDSVEVGFGSSLTLSNEVEGRLRIDLAGGRAMLIAHPYPQAEG